MPQGLHGITAGTSGRLVIDAGACYVGYTDAENPGDLVGATRNGNAFNLTRTIRRIPADGSLGPTKGLRRREEIVAQITVNLLEVTLDNFRRAIAGANVDMSDPDQAVITGGEIQDGDYISNVAIVGTLNGTDIPVVALVTNALAEGPFNMALNDRDEVVIPVTFTGHFDPADMDTEPWQVYLPQVAGES